MKGRFTLDVEQTGTLSGPSLIENLSDSHLISRCQENDRLAWEEFFRRHIPLIKTIIKRKLLSYGYDPDRGTHDAVWDIHEKIVVKLYSRGVLSQCVDSAGFYSWLKTIVQNQVTDWVKEQNRNKRLPQTQSEEFMLYFSAPLQDGKSAVLQDFIEDKNESFEHLAEQLENILEKMAEIEDPKKMWILRLSLIALLPLSHDDLLNFSEYLKISPEELRQQIDKLQENVESKRKKQIETMGRAVVLWHDIKRLQHRMSNLEKSLQQNEKITALRIKIEEKSKRRKELLKTGTRFVRPTNKDIAELVGIPEDKAEQISTFISRARKSLSSSLEIQLDDK